MTSIRTCSSRARPDRRSNVPYAHATDLAGRVTWYYDSPPSGFTLTNPGQSLVPGGTVLVIGVDRYAPLPASRNVLREIDLAGDPLRETNVAAVNAQLAALGHDTIHSFHHDAQRLPDGRTAAIAFTERTVDINGTPTNYIGDMVVVLDADFRVTWAWDAFDHLDVNRGPVLGEVMLPGRHGTDGRRPPPAGGRLAAHQHREPVARGRQPGPVRPPPGLGDQDRLPRTGRATATSSGGWAQGGDFTLNFTDPDPWFSHQHNAHYVDDHTLILFDNGNTRRASDPTANSRGQVWTLDERRMTATPGSTRTWGTTPVRARELPSGSRTGTTRSRRGRGPSPPFVAQSSRCGPTAPRSTSSRWPGRSTAPTGCGPCTRGSTTRWRGRPGRSRASSSTTGRPSGRWSTASPSPSAGP